MAFNIKTSILLLAFIPMVCASVFGQNPADSVKRNRHLNNVVRYNLSGPIMFGSSYAVLGYERVLKNGNSISVNGGHAALPKVLNFNYNDAVVSGIEHNTGINLSIDYRIYLKKENKYRAPRGVYIGPYYSYNHFERTVDWKFDDNNGGTAEASVEAALGIHTIGFEVGYQFALGKRFTLDLIMIGPGQANTK